LLNSSIIFLHKKTPSDLEAFFLYICNDNSINFKSKLSKMKKLLLSTFSLMLALGLMAQSPMQKQSDRLSKVVNQKMPAQTEYNTSFTGDVNPYVSTIKAPDIVIGNTRYDLQSNTSMASRIHKFEDGTIGATWTFGIAETSYPERGTGYNYHNGTSWGPAPTARIEPVRNGWPSYQPYGPNGEIVCSHTGGTAGLIFSYRETKGTGDWNFFYLQGPTGFQDLLWPRMMTSGENHEIIHVIAALDAAYQGLDGALLYSRSVDGGQTWFPENEILDGLTSSDIFGVEGDAYAWAPPKGDTIAFIVGDFAKDGVVLKSYDNGENWESMFYYQAPIPLFGNEVPLPNHGGIDGYQSAVIDDLGRVHVAAGRMIHSADGTGGPTNYYPYSNGLLYWNETMAPLDSAQIKADILDVSGMNPLNLLAEVWDNGVDTIIGVATYQASLTSMPQLAFDYDNKILYAFYSGLALGFATEEFNYRHVWMRFSDDYGQTWSPYQDLTGDIFHIFSECAWLSVASKVDDQVHLLYHSDNAPGNAVRFEGHGVNDNYAVYLPVATVVGIEEKPASILDINQITPNPATDIARMVVHVDRAVTAQFSLVNMLGQEVYERTSSFGYAGPHTLELDVRNYDAGIYFVRVKAGNSVSVKKLIIN
jgi:hypothetical protein